MIDVLLLHPSPGIEAEALFWSSVPRVPQTQRPHHLVPAESITFTAMSMLSS